VGRWGLVFSPITQQAQDNVAAPLECWRDLGAVAFLCRDTSLAALTRKANLGVFWGAALQVTDDDHGESSSGAVGCLSRQQQLNSSCNARYQAAAYVDEGQQQV